MLFSFVKPNSSISRQGQRNNQQYQRSPSSPGTEMTTTTTVTKDGTVTTTVQKHTSPSAI